MKELSIKREKFAQLYFSGKTQAEAYGEAYGVLGMSKDGLEVSGCQLARKPEIKERIKELHREAVSGVIMVVKERKEVLSKVIRGELAAGGDMFIVIRGIAELNKMERVYGDNGQGGVTNNTQVNIIVKDKETREVVEKVMGGRRLMLGGGDGG